MFLIENMIETAYATFIISPYLRDTVEELSRHFIENVFKFKKNGKNITIEKAVKMGLLKFNIIIEEKLNNTEWILITKNNKYYSKGDNSN